MGGWAYRPGTERETQKRGRRVFRNHALDIAVSLCGGWGEVLGRTLLDHPDNGKDDYDLYEVFVSALERGWRTDVLISTTITTTRLSPMIELPMGASHLRAE